MSIFKLGDLNNQVEDQVNDEDTDSKQPKDIQNEGVLENEDVEQTNIGGKNFINIIIRMKQWDNSIWVMVDIFKTNLDFVFWFHV